MKKNSKIKIQSLNLKQLCELVTTMQYPYEDIAEFIEKRTLELVQKGNLIKTQKILEKMALFFEQMEHKNEEICRDVASIYILLGESCQHVGQYAKSVEWFKKAILFDDRNSMIYHYIAESYSKMNDSQNAIRSLEEEIHISPGNFFAYFALADIYQRLGQLDNAEACYKNLLERDPNNLQAIHRLIEIYTNKNPAVDVSYLRRRIIDVHKPLNKIELTIWTFHVCVLGQYEKALSFLNNKKFYIQKFNIVHLLNSHIYRMVKQFPKMREELLKFNQKYCGKSNYMKSEEFLFSHVFGHEALRELYKTKEMFDS